MGFSLNHSKLKTFAEEQISQPSSEEDAGSFETASKAMDWAQSSDRSGARESAGYSF